MGNNFSRNVTSLIEDKKWVTLNEASLFQPHFLQDHLTELLEHGFGEEEEAMSKQLSTKTTRLDNPFQLELRFEKKKTLEFIGIFNFPSIFLK